MIDAELDRTDHDTAAKMIEAMRERVRWIIYQALYAQGLRIDRAPHEIARLAPRKEGR